MSRQRAKPTAAPRAILLAGASWLVATGCQPEEPENCWPGIEQGRNYSIRIVERHAEGSAWFGLISPAASGPPGQIVATGPSCGAAMEYASGLEITFTVAGKRGDPDHGGCLTSFGPLEGLTDVTFLDDSPDSAPGGIELFYVSRWAKHGTCEGLWEFSIHGNQASRPDPFAAPVPGVPPAIYLTRSFEPYPLSVGCTVPGRCVDFYVIDLDPL